MKYEYRVLCCDKATIRGDSPDHFDTCLEQRLNDLSAEGWEIKTVISNSIILVRETSVETKKTSPEGKDVKNDAPLHQPPHKEEIKKGK